MPNIKIKFPKDMNKHLKKTLLLDIAIYGVCFYETISTITNKIKNNCYMRINPKLVNRKDNKIGAL